MQTESLDLAQVSRTLAVIRDELAHLNARVHALEASKGAVGPAAAPVVADRAPAPAAQPEPVSEELIVVISAAIAAFLGKKPHIRQIRLIGGASWVQQGRATVQASHQLDVHHR